MSKEFSIKFKNYKCFSSENTIDNIKAVNLLIGKNNSGKTSALDVVEKVLSKIEIKNELINHAVIDYGTIVDNSTYRVAFRSDTFLGFDYGPSNSLYERGKALLDVEMFFPLQNSNYIDPTYTNLEKKNKSVFSRERLAELTRAVINSIPKYDVYKISAERDVKKENANGTIDIDSNGNGITRLVGYHLLNVKGNYRLIKGDILNALNEILAGENEYSDITVLNDSDVLEIYLYENDRRIPLSLMGSGLKTILFVLIVLFLSKHTNSRSLFLFEELENNLHPEIQRRLFNYIYNFAITNDSIVFITSHSHVAINCFYGKDDSTIFHIHKDNGGSIIERVNNDADKALILNDLGVLASDIFQTNGIIWVEGPSDRVYIKKWLAVKYPELKENEDYTFLYYGGKNLFHFTADSDKENELINILLTNRNGLIVMDHDGNSAADEIRDTKKRIKEEFDSKGMYVWITEGKEIENYIKVKDINKAFGESDLQQVGSFDPFKDYIYPIVKNFENQKVAFSQKLEFDEDSLKIMDLERKIDDIALIIKKWNKK